MKFFTFNSIACAIWLYPPNWGAKSPTLTPSHVTTRNTTIRNVQTRVKFSNTMRWKFDFTALIPSADIASELREGLGRLKNEQVFMPVWVDETGISSDIAPGNTTINIRLAPTRYSRYFVILDSNRNYEIITVNTVSYNALALAVGTTNGWSAKDCMICPLMAGRFEPRPSFADDSDIVSEPQVTFIEDCNVTYSLAPIGMTLTSVGSTISAFSTYTLWDVRPTFDQQTDSTEVDIAIDPIGFFRQTQRTVYPQSVRRVFEYTFICTDRLTIQRIENLFSQQSGPILQFMLPTFRGDLSLATDLPESTANWMTVQNWTYSDPAFNTTPGKGYLALSDATRLQPLHVTTIIGGTLICEANITGTWKVGQTQISNLVLVTMQDSNLQWTYESGQVATTKLKFIEVTEEYSSIGTIVNPIYLYRFTHKVPTAQVYRFTSDEVAVVISGDGTYQPGPFNHKNIKLSLDPTSDESQIESYDFSGNPLSLITRSGSYGLNGKLICEIIETNRFNLSVTLQTFWGMAVQSDPEGNKFTVTFRPIDSALDQKSRMMFHRQCVWDLYGQGCGVPIASNRFTMTVSSVSGTSVYLVAYINLPAQYFSWGYLETPGKTSLYEIRAINYSNAFTVAGSPVYVQVARPFLYLVPGDTVYVYPGCAKRYNEDCIAKFNNGINFGGNPFIPVDPPNVIGVPTKSGAGGGGKGGGGGK
jgi:uncharacterized phage protein (TIGR02218 family)